jgi:hypothetical protein
MKDFPWWESGCQLIGNSIVLESEYTEEEAAKALYKFVKKRYSRMFSDTIEGASWGIAGRLYQGMDEIEKHALIPDKNANSYLQHAARARRTIGEFDQAITDSVELALSFYLFGGASSQQALSRARMLKTAKTGSFLAKRHLTAEIKQAIIVAAKQYQLKSGYMADAWTVVKLKKGTKIYGLLPGQGAFYTTAKFASLVKRENISAKTASELLQIAKHPKYPYRNKVQEYVLKDDVYVAMSTIAANPSSGKGGMVQYFIPNFSKILKNGDWHQILAE